MNAGAGEVARVFLSPTWVPPPSPSTPSTNMSTENAISPSSSARSILSNSSTYITTTDSSDNLVLESFNGDGQNKVDTQIDIRARYEKKALQALREKQQLKLKVNYFYYFYYFSSFSHFLILHYCCSIS